MARPPLYCDIGTQLVYQELRAASVVGPLVQHDMKVGPLKGFPRRSQLLWLNHEVAQAVCLCRDPDRIVDVPQGLI